MTSSFTSRLGTAPEEAIKAPVSAATDANITLVGEQTIDGVAVVAGNRVLVKDQTDTTENGIYVVAIGAWERASDWNDTEDAVSGVIVLDASKSRLYQAVFTGQLNPGSTPVTFTLFYATPDDIITFLDDIIVAANRTITVSDQFPDNVVGNDGDLWFKVP